MEIKIQTYLYDILNAVNEIESFVDDDLSIELYGNDIKTKRAIERNIEIIGEAMNRILKEKEDISISNSRKIVDSRNKIIHGYDVISDELIFGIVRNYIPKLKKEVQNLLNE
ncbi:MAG: DUF86 domain-containing protein [Flavobacteriales bacterium]|nr:DUF86 domain-containing protein [Flavobacteriales bacterium]